MILFDIFTYNFYFYQRFSMIFFKRSLFSYLVLFCVSCFCSESESKKIANLIETLNKPLVILQCDSQATKNITIPHIVFEQFNFSDVYKDFPAPLPESIPFYETLEHLPSKKGSDLNYLGQLFEIANLTTACGLMLTPHILNELHTDNVSLKM